ncbi:MAG: Hsp33 family molecular chaperone HslO [Gammaproteobacteria bacterium]|nr:Hsp33 family molecular chaperone HslO [Gammaproteobacteria bacterium]
MRARKDSLYRFVVEDSNVRGQLVYLDEAWQTLASRHDYPPAVRQVLGEAVSAAALLSATLKFRGSLTIQARGDGDLRMLVAEAGAGGTLRGLARWRGRIPQGNLPELLGNGRLAITIDPGEGRDRYQGIVELGQGGLAEALHHYFAHSEQIPTRLLLAVDENRVAGLLLQKVATAGEEDDDADLAEPARAAWRDSISRARAMDAGALLELGVGELLSRLHGDRPVHLYRGQGWRFHCGCTRESVEAVLRAIGKRELDALLAELGEVSVSCEFCDAEFRFDPVDVGRVLAGAGPPEPDIRH